MDLKKKLSMISNRDAIEADLADISAIPHEEKQITPDVEEDSVEDFNLGELSIDSLLKSEGILEKKSKKSKQKVTKKSGSESFADIFSSIHLDEDLGEYRTGNKDLDAATARSKDLLSQADMLQAADFDAFLDDSNLFEAEENAEMRTNLVAMGRKYARDTAASKDMSEINQAYADTEKKLLDLFTEVSQDKVAIQKDIDRMRTPGRAGKIFSDMIAAKNSYHSTQLSILKELNAIKKNKFDLKAKEQARKEQEAQGGNDLSANTIQSIFSSARGNIVDSMGGYSSVSGALESNSDDDVVIDLGYEDDDEIIQKKYFNNQDVSESDGDKWLKYENRGVEYIALLDSDNHVTDIIAEDRDGVLIPDYPKPNNFEQLSFDIDKIAKTATDNLHRNYKIRYIDE